MNNKVIKEPWGETIESEHNELKEKYYKLINYINSEEFYKLSPNTKKVINNQKVLIESYMNNLSVLLYENIDTSFIQDYSLFGLLFSTFSSGFSTPFGNSSSTDSTSIESNEAMYKFPVKQ